MKRTKNYFLFFLLIIFSCSVLAAKPISKKSVALTDSMNFDQIALAMKAYPPQFAKFGDERLKIFESVDTLINFSVKHDSVRTNPVWVNNLQQMGEFYRNSIDRGLDALEKTKVTNGVFIVKLYSSSLVLKTKEGIVAVDICQGPVGNTNEPEFVDYYKSGIYMTNAQRDRLAKLVDVLLITHNHHDHADYSLSHRMVKMGKKVVGPKQLKEYWPEIASGITVPTYNTTQKIGQVDMITQFGYQYATLKKDSNGQTFGERSENKSSDAESIRYLFKLGGITFIHGAETYDDAYEWMTNTTKAGWSVDVVVSTGMGQGGRSVMKYFKDTKHQYIDLPVHEHELMHYNGGSPMALYLKDDYRTKFDQRKLVKLFWGESILLKK